MFLPIPGLFSCAGVNRRRELPSLAQNAVVHTPRPNTMVTVLRMRLAHTLRQPLSFVELRGVSNPEDSLQSGKETPVNIEHMHSHTMG